jgi:protein involved in polysaccharide export with SLBB domain
VNFEKLIKEGDFNQNFLLNANDTVLIPNIKDKKVFVLGEVNKPLSVALRPGVTLVESISMAGDFTENARRENVVIVRGGLGHPTLLTVNVDAITQKGETVANVPLEPGDIVYVPKSLVASVVKFFQNLASILTPLVLAESGIVLGPSMEAVLTGRSITGQAVSPQPVVSPQPAVTGR